MLVNGVPQAQLGGDSPVEATQQRQAVGPLGCGGQAQQLDRRHVVGQPLVRPGDGVVELVDDGHVEVIGRQIIEAGGVQLELRRTVAAHACLPKTSARRTPARAWRSGTWPGSGPGSPGRSPRYEERGPSGPATKSPRAGNWRDEQQPGPRQLGPQAHVVQRRHHGLARAGGRHQQVAVVALAAGDGDLLQQPLLERLGAQLDRAEQHGRARVAGPLGLTVELVAWVHRQQAYGRKSPDCQYDS